MKYDRHFVIYFNINITVFMCRSSIFSSDMTMISYLNIIINIIIIPNSRFSRYLKILIAFFSHYKFFVKMLFHHATAVFTFFDYIINKIADYIFSQVCLKILAKLIIITNHFIAMTLTNLFLVLARIRLFWI